MCSRNIQESLMEVTPVDPRLPQLNPFVSKICGIEASLNFFFFLQPKPPTSYIKLTCYVSWIPVSYY